MNYKIIVTNHFNKELKRLAKKYKSLKNEVESLGTTLQSNPTQGKHLGNNIYKIRISIASKGKGKRGGARVMSYVKIVNETVYLFSIYSKGEKNNISDTEIRALTRNIL